MAEITRQKTLEDEIQDIYVRYRRRIHPDFNPSVTKHGPAWLKIAKVVADLGADPRLYVEAQFELGYAQHGEKSIYPESLSSDRAIAVFQEYEVKFRSIPERTVEEQTRRLADAIQYGGLTRDQALLHPEVSLYAWFRMIACTDGALAMISDQYLAAARRELVKDVDLSNYLQNYFNDRYKSRIWQTVSGHSDGTSNPLPEASLPTHLRTHIGRGSGLPGASGDSGGAQERN